MITPTEIKEKAMNKYLAYLRSVVQDCPFETIVITGNKKPSSNLSVYRSELESLISQSTERKGYGYTIKYKTINKKEIGRQDVPTEILFLTEIDFLRFLRKEKEVQAFKDDYKFILSKFPQLEEWVSKYPKKIIDNHSKWNELLSVCSYFIEVPRPNLYIRELPIKVHTKFIENNKSIIKELLDILIPEFVNSKESNFEMRFNLRYDEPSVRFRILDESISSKYLNGITDLCIPISQFETLKLPIRRVFIAENKMNVLTFPIIEKSLVIFGSGFKVEILKNTEWLKDTELYYWGDIDAHGFEILSQFRGYFSNTKSILMDSKTFSCFFENDKGTLSTNPIIENLTLEEEELYKKIKDNNWRLEQEKISFSYLQEALGYQI